MATVALHPHRQTLPSDIRLLNAVSALLFAVAVVALLLVGFNALSRSSLFAIAGIRIEGEVTRNSAATIRANVMRKLHGNFFSIDLAQAKNAFEAVPWVREAVVSRVWPNRLAVTLQEHRAAAIWRGADGVEKLVNLQGEVFDANLGDVDDDELPTLAGPDGSSAHVLRMYARMQPVVAPLPNAEATPVRIDTLTLSGRGSWRLELDDGADVELGRGEDDEVIARAERFVRTLPQIAARYPQHPLLSADLRHRDGYAVRLKGVSTNPDKPSTEKR